MTTSLEDCSSPPATRNAQSEWRRIVSNGLVASMLTSAGSSFVHWVLLARAERTPARLVTQFSISYAAAVLIVLLVLPWVIPLFERRRESRGKCRHT